MRLEGTSIKRNILGAIFRNPFFFLSIFKKGCIQQSLKKMHARDIQDHPDVIDLWHTDTHLTSSCFFQFGTKKERMLSLHFLG